MLINRDLLMREAIEKYSGKTYSRAKIKLCYDAIDMAQQWAVDHNGYDKVKLKSTFFLRRHLYSYVRNRISPHKHAQTILGICPSIVWILSIRPVIKWITLKIIEDYT